MAQKTSDKLLEDFCTWLQEQDRSPLTVRGYISALRQFSVWFRQTNGVDVEPARITPLDIKAYRQYLLVNRRLKPATVNHHLAALRALARWAERTGQVEHNPAQGIKLVQEVVAAPRWLMRSEQFSLLRKARERVQLGDLRAQGQPDEPGYIWPRRDLALLVLLLNTGLRLAEVAALTLSDVVLKERSGAVTVRSGKGRKARTVPLNHDARKALQEWLDVRPAVSTGALWLSQKGGALSTRALAARITMLAEQAGLEDVSTHTLRHSFAKNLVDAGVSLEKVATLLGHDNLETTRLYTTPSEADLQAATEQVAWEA